MCVRPQQESSQGDRGPLTMMCVGGTRGWERVNSLGTSSMDTRNEPGRDRGGLVFMHVGKHSGLKDPGSPGNRTYFSITGL